ncbi:MAG: hypothetical protein HY961_16205 [Ignavibacteriae bacterium]|nr:hypothetical protein [Ignavibacteriota bacterium]
MNLPDRDHARRIVRSFRRKDMLLPVIIVLLTGAHWLILVFRLPVFTSLPYWFFPFYGQRLHVGWIVAATAALVAAVATSFSRARPFVKVLLLIMFGACIQFTINFSQGNGLAGIRDRIVHTGHAEFATLAVHQAGMLDVALNYEAKVQAGELGRYAPSKPPGTLLLYMMFERFANMREGDISAAQRLENLRTFASITWPFVSYLVLIPLWMLGRSLIGEQRAVGACLLYLTIPSVNLITLHLDQVVFPLMAIVPVALLRASCDRRSPALAVVSGVMLYAAGFLSFALIVVAVVMMTLLLISFVQKPTGNARPMLMFSIAALAGVGVSDIVMRLLLDYDIVTRFINASQHHAMSKGWEGGLALVATAGLTNVVEFAVWIGLPVSLLFVVAAVSSAKRILSVKRIESETGFALSLVAVFLLLLVFGRTKAETARLWMFLIPFICVVASGVIHKREVLLATRWPVFMSLVVALEIVTTCLTLRFQNFF